MAELTVLYWRDIPAQVIVKEGRRQARRQLNPRFQAAIDSAAMKAGLAGTDDYLNEWRRAQPEACEDDVEAAAEAAAARLEAAFDAKTLARLVAAGGRSE